MDNQTFFYIAERAASGVPPHVSVINHKLALSHLLSGGAIRIGRALDADDVMAARALSVAAAAATVAVVASLALRLTGSTTAAVLSVLVMLGFNGFLRQAAMGFRPQLFSALFTVVALHACFERRLVWSGLFAGCALLTWQPAVVIPFGLAVASLFDVDRWRTMARLAFGGLIAFLAMEAYFMWHGVAGEQLSQSLLMASYGTGKLPWVHRTLAYLLWSDGGPPAVKAIVPALFLLSVAGMLVWAARNRAAAWRAWLDRHDLRAALACGGATLAFLFIDRQAYPDKLVLLPFMALTLAALVAATIDRLAGASRLGRQIATALCCLALLTVAVELATAFQVKGNPLARERQLARKVLHLERRHGPVWAIGCLHLLAFEREQNFAPVGILIDERVRRYIGGRTYRPRASGEMPAVILASRLREPFEPFWLHREYVEIVHRDFTRESVQVYLRTDLLAGSGERRQRARGRVTSGLKRKARARPPSAPF